MHFLLFLYFYSCGVLCVQAYIVVYFFGHSRKCLVIDWYDMNFHYTYTCIFNKHIHISLNLLKIIIE